MKSCWVERDGACFGVGRQVSSQHDGVALGWDVMSSQHDEFALEEAVMLGRT